MLRKCIWYLSHITPHFKGKEFILRMLTRPSNDNSKHRIMRNATNFLISGLDLNEFNLAIRKYHSIQMHVCISKLITHLHLKIFMETLHIKQPLLQSP